MTLDEFRIAAGVGLFWAEMYAPDRCTTIRPTLPDGENTDDA